MILYLDTSVLSALFDARNPERVEITKEFFVARTSDRLLVSELTLAEIAATPSHDLRVAMAEVADRCETIDIGTDADRLASRYIEAGAIAVTCAADMVVSWNFRHIVRRKTRDVVNMVNTMHGYPHIEIVAPGELL